MERLSSVRRRALTCEPATSFASKPVTTLARLSRVLRRRAAEPRPREGCGVKARRVHFIELVPHDAALTRLTFPGMRDRLPLSAKRLGWVDRSDDPVVGKTHPGDDAQIWSVP
jgi:hypothetical protein